MKKNSYKSVDVKKIEDEAKEKLDDQVRGKRIVLGIDIAKTKDFGAILTSEHETIRIITWNKPKDVKYLIEFLKSLPASKLEVAMESSGTYGDALRTQLIETGIDVYKVSGQRINSAADVFDGVPSLHDPKCAVLIAKLHLERGSEKWELKSEYEQELDVYVEQMDLYKMKYRSDCNRLEAMLARYWPEINILSLGSATQLALLETFGCPSEVAKDPDRAMELMRKVSRNFLSEEKIKKVVAGSKVSIGIKPIAAQLENLKELSREIGKLRKKLDEAKEMVKKHAQKNELIMKMAKAVSIVTAAAIYSKAGNPAGYSCPAAYVKALGLNLKIKSSGKKKGQLKITKRGSGRARFYLYMSVLRLIQSCSLFAAWYHKKVKRDGGRLKGRSVVALMRKLASGLWHAAQGNDYNAEKLFNLKNLGLVSKDGTIYKIQSNNTLSLTAQEQAS